jgi:hypothetical protein
MVGYYWGNRYKVGDTDMPAVEAVLVRPAVELPEFELRDATGQAFTLASFDGRWTLMAFGALDHAAGHLAVARMIDVHNRLAVDPQLQAMLQLSLVAKGQDPILARDFGRLSPALKLLSGDSGEVQRLRAALGAAPEEGTGDTGDTYVPLYLTGPGGRLLALFPGAQPAASIASDLSAIAAHPRLRGAGDD